MRAPGRGPRAAARAPRGAAAFLAAVAMALGCGGEPEGPEARIRALVDRAEAAAEAHEVGALKDLVSPRYADEQGRDAAAVRGLLGIHFLRNQSVHVLTRIESIDLPAPERATLRVIVAMAGAPFPPVEELERLRADVYRFELGLALEDDAWLVSTARWEPLRLGAPDP